MNIFRIILDTSMIFTGLKSRNPTFFKDILDLHPTGFYQLFASNYTFEELKNILTRPDTGLDPDDVADFIDWYQSVVIFVEPKEAVKISRDHTDDPFLSLAKAVDADYLLSLDKDLLVLEQVGQTRICKAKEFYEVLSQNL